MSICHHSAGRSTSKQAQQESGGGEGGSFRRRSRGRAGAQRNTQACTPAPTRAISSIMVGCVAQILPYDVSDSLVTRLSRLLAATAAPHPHHTSILCTHTQHLAHVIEPTATVCARVWLGCAAAPPHRPASPPHRRERALRTSFRPLAQATQNGLSVTHSQTALVH